METITLEIPDSVAKKWRNTPLIIRKKFEKQFEDQIDYIDYIDKQIHFQKLENILENIGKQAKVNGLTEDILKELLKDE